MPDPPALARVRRPALEPFQPVARDRHGRFVSGSSGNPKGAPVSFVEYIRHMTGGGQEMVDHALECLRGFVRVQWEDEHTGDLRERLMPADPRYQLEARAWLADHGYGKAPQTIEVQQVTEGVRSYAQLEAHELREMLRLEAKMEGRKAPESGGLLPTLGSEGLASSEGEEEADTVPSPTVPPGT